MSALDRQAALGPKQTYGTVEAQAKSRPWNSLIIRDSKPNLQSKHVSHQYADREASRGRRHALDRVEVPDARARKERSASGQLRPLEAPRKDAPNPADPTEHVGDRKSELHQSIVVSPEPTR